MDMCQQICIFDMIVTRKKKNTSKLQTIWVYFLFFSFRIISTDTAGKYLLFFSRNVKKYILLEFFKNNGWEAPASPTETELLLPAGLWINFLMLPFQNIHDVPGGG